MRILKNLGIFVIVPVVCVVGAIGAALFCCVMAAYYHVYKKYIKPNPT